MGYRRLELTWLFCVGYLYITRRDRLFRKWVRLEWLNWIADCNNIGVITVLCKYHDRTRYIQGQSTKAQHAHAVERWFGKKNWMQRKTVFTHTGVGLSLLWRTLSEQLKDRCEHFLCSSTWPINIYGEHELTGFDYLPCLCSRPTAANIYLPSEEVVIWLITPAWQTSNEFLIVWRMTRSLQRCNNRCSNGWRKKLSSKKALMNLQLVSLGPSSPTSLEGVSWY